MKQIAVTPEQFKLIHEGYVIGFSVLGQSEKHSISTLRDCAKTLDMFDSVSEQSKDDKGALNYYFTGDPVRVIKKKSILTFNEEQQNIIVKALENCPWTTKAVREGLQIIDILKEASDNVIPMKKR